MSLFGDGVDGVSGGGGACLAARVAGFLVG